MDSSRSITTGLDDRDYMPLDIIFRILLWLPVSSLLRLKSVSKSWFSLIQNSDFIYQHLRHTSDNNTKLILMSCADEFNKQQLSLVSIHNKTDEHLLDFPIIDDPYHCFSVELAASCNGIICLRQNRRVCLWNPATKQTINLPPLPQLPIHCYIGFGFDVNTNDYKVVYLNQNRNDTAHIYSLSSDSWRTMNTCVLNRIYIGSDLKTPYRAGIYCWSGVTYGSGKVSIMSFDFTTEVFETIPLPDSERKPPRTLFILRGNIACISGEDVYPAETSQTYEIWVLSDYNVKDSWIKLYLIEFSSIFYWIAWFSKSAAEFLVFLKEKQLCFYNLATQETMNLPVHVSFGFEVVTYQESLVSLKRGNGAANGGSSIQDRNQRMLINQSLTGKNNSWCDIDLPQVVVFQILLRLPVLSLLRFKSVCKSWCSLIKGFNFVAQHFLLHRNDTYNINLILHYCYAKGNPMFEDSSHAPSTTSPTCLLSTNKLELLDLPYFESWYSESVEIIASFDGIICLQVSEEFDVYLWNPASKQFRVVEVEWEWLFSRNDANYFRIGFGFDVKTNEYKLVRFHNEDDFDTPKVEVFSLSANSWRTVGDVIPPAIEAVDSGLQAPYCSGINHWLAVIDRTSCSYTILSFDFSNEVFGTIPLPDSLNKPPFFLELIVLRGNIACISTDRKYLSKEAKNWQCEIWIMNEYGVKESWTKLYMVGPFSQDWHMRKVFSKKNADYILLQKDGQLYEYEIVTRETKELRVPSPWT